MQVKVVPCLMVMESHRRWLSEGAGCKGIVLFHAPPITSIL